MREVIDRRTLLKGSFAAALAAALPGDALAQQSSSPSDATKAALLPTAAQNFRFVHLTDIHVQPELRASEGMAKALAAVERLNPKPDLILAGGDQVFDVFEQDVERAKLLFEMFRRIRRDGTNLPLHCAIGNHDVFGWSEQKGITPSHALYGKKLACEAFEMPREYYAITHKGWRFYVLDTIQPNGKQKYNGGLDDEQLAWFEADLKAKPAGMPAVVMTHIPILTVLGFVDKLFQENEYRLPSALVCRGASKLTSLLSTYNVRLALSGHIHQLDRIEVKGVTYICDGAVSGNWWKGVNNGTEEGFGIFDLKANGTFEYKYHDFGWEV